VLYIAATIACIGLPSARPAVRPVGTSRSQEAREALGELREGFAVVIRDREISRPIIHQAASASVAGVLGVLGPGLARSVGINPDQLIVVVLPLGIGVVLGVLGMRRLSRLPRWRVAELGLLCFGGLTASLALVAPLRNALNDVSVVPLLATIGLVAGAAYAVTLVSAQTALLESMPADVRGRVFGVLASITSTASLLPALLAGPLADRISAPLVLVIVGLIVVSVALWSALLFGPRRAKSGG
ncbi:MAG: hypothetical protein ACRDGQ_13940, partial [Candidatus Limnocylindrales bacterium]